MSEFNRIINGDIEVLLDKEDSAPEQKIEPSMEWRNMVSRETNTVENVDGAGNLFELEQFLQRARLICLCILHLIKQFWKVFY